MTPRRSTSRAQITLMIMIRAAAMRVLSFGRSKGRGYRQMYTLASLLPKDTVYL
jgi:hypothetical protein